MRLIYVFESFWKSFSILILEILVFLFSSLSRFKKYFEIRTFLTSTSAFVGDYFRERIPPPF